MPFTSLQAFLLDNFLNTITPISLTDSSFIDFTVTTNAASAASNRFKIVFKEFAALPLRIVSINAASKDDAIIVKWDVKNENDGLEYDVERSADGIHFTQLATVKAVNNGGESYSWTDNRPFAGDNYYRVRSKSQDANISYTETVKVSLKTSADGISASFNPVTNGTLHLKFNSEPAGIYTVTLFNAAGQVMLLTNIKHTPATTDEAIFTGQLAKGIYRVEVTRPTGKSTVISVMY